MENQREVQKSDRKATELTPYGYIKSQARIRSPDSRSLHQEKRPLLSSKPHNKGAKARNHAADRKEMEQRKPLS